VVWRPGGVDRPRDPIQVGKLIVDIATGQIGDSIDGKSEKAVSRGRLGGVSGGLARAQKMPADERRRIARKAAPSPLVKARKVEKGICAAIRGYASFGA
jgi:hypothetical protein